MGAVKAKPKRGESFNRDFNSLSSKRQKKNAQVMPGVNLSDACFAAMASIPNPELPDWASDSSKLPKKPPGRA
jgi:hypothetical protein